MIWFFFLDLFESNLKSNLKFFKWFQIRSILNQEIKSSNTLLFITDFAFANLVSFIFVYVINLF